MSLSGAGVLLSSASELTGVTHLELSLNGDGVVSAAVQPVHVHQVGNGTPIQHVGLKFIDPAVEFLEQICRILIKTHSQTPDRPSFLRKIASFTTVTDPKRLARLLTHAVRSKHSFRLFDSGENYLGTFTATSGPERLIGNLTQTATLVPRIGDTLSFSTCSFNCLYLFQVPLLSIDGDEYCFEFPQSMQLGGLRDTTRVPVPAGTPIRLEILHPYHVGVVISRQVLEAGVGGVSFYVDVPEDLLIPGMVIHSAVLRLPNQLSLPCRIAIRHIDVDLSGRHRCGVEILELGPPGRDKWVEQILNLIAPDVEEVAHTELPEIWSLYRKTLYLDEKPTEIMEALEEAFCTVWQQLLMSRGTCRLWAFRRSGTKMGTIALSRLYSNSWMSHQLAADMDAYHGPGHKLMVPYTLIPQVMLSWVAGISVEGSMVMYYDADKQFNRWAWSDFFSTIGDEQLCKMQSFKLYDFDCAQQSGAPIQEPYLWCREPTLHEKALISEDLRRREGDLVHRAFDYAPELLDQRSWGDDIDGHLIRRQRQIIVAGMSDRMIGYALADSAANGVNIFSLYNTAQIVLVEPQHPGASTIKRVLFQRLVGHYRQRHIPSFLFLSACDDDQPPEQLKPTFGANAQRVTISCRLLPLWMAHLTDLWRHR